MSHKSYSLILIGAALCFALASILFWHIVTKPAFYGYDSHGDLTRLGSFYIQPPLTHNIAYQKHHKELRDYLTEGSADQFSVLTIGDSHSDGVGGAYYQDYLADKYGISVINSAGTHKYNSWAQLNMLIDLGYLGQLGIKTVVFEIGERGVSTLTAPPSLPAVARKEYEKDRIAYKEASSRDMVPPYALLTTTMGSANVRFIKNRLYASNHEYSVSKDVYKEYLTIPAFTNTGQENVLYYYHDDLDYLTAKPDAVAINNTLNAISDKLATRGVKFIFFVVPDKSDVYFPYVARERNIPENNFIAELMPLPKTYEFIDSKKILRDAVAAGEQDLFWADDTHWSWKAQQHVGDAIATVLQNAD